MNSAILSSKTEVKITDHNNNVSKIPYMSKLIYKTFNKINSKTTAPATIAIDELGVHTISDSSAYQAYKLENGKQYKIIATIKTDLYGTITKTFYSIAKNNCIKFGDTHIRISVDTKTTNVVSINCKKLVYKEIAFTYFEHVSGLSERNEIKAKHNINFPCIHDAQPLPEFKPCKYNNADLKGAFTKLSYGYSSTKKVPIFMALYNSSRTSDWNNNTIYWSLDGITWKKGNSSYLSKTPVHTLIRAKGLFIGVSNLQDYILTTDGYFNSNEAIYFGTSGSSLGKSSVTSNSKGIKILGNKIFGFSRGIESGDNNGTTLFYNNAISTFEFDQENRSVINSTSVSWNNITLEETDPNLAGVDFPIGDYTNAPEILDIEYGCDPRTTSTQDYLLCLEYSGVVVGKNNSYTKWVSLTNQEFTSINAFYNTSGEYRLLLVGKPGIYIGKYTQSSKTLELTATSVTVNLNRSKLDYINNMFWVDGKHYSYDGETWYSLPKSYGHITFGNGLFLSSSGKILYYSIDGINWKQYYTFTDSINAIQYTATSDTSGIWHIGTESYGGGCLYYAETTSETIPLIKEEL